MSDFTCRVCGRNLRAAVAEALVAGEPDFGFQRNSDCADAAGYRIVEVECPLRHKNSFRLRSATSGD